MSTRGWWRANALPLGILAVLLPASIVSIGWRDWTEATSTAFHRTTAITAEDGETAELADATWGPIRSGVISDTSGLTPPPHTKVIVVVIPVDTDPADPVRCDYPLLIEQSTGRQWNEMSYELGVDYSSTENRTCAYDAVGPYEIAVPFAIPEDVEGPFWVDVVPYKALGEDGLDADGGTGTGGKFVRFPIAP